MKWGQFAVGIAVGTGIGTLVTVAYFMLQALTIRAPRDDVVGTEAGTAVTASAGEWDGPVISPSVSHEPIERE
jgi:hypothetical protein